MKSRSRTKRQYNSLVIVTHIILPNTLVGSHPKAPSPTIDDYPNATEQFFEDQIKKFLLELILIHA